MKNLSEDIIEVQLKADGSWQPKLQGEAKYWEQWRLPSSAEIPLVSPQKPMQQKTLPVTGKLEEGLSEGKGPLRLGLKQRKQSKPRFGLSYKRGQSLEAKCAKV